ncbi:MAG: bifunctional sugar-1-phosphate nucleotidylyltransferase/acetyltransferase [Candidatus Aenigmatarchaeota archaeon]
MKAVVIAAGKGTRMQPLTLTMSKGMLPVANKPVLQWTCEFLDFCDEIIIIVNENQRDIISHFINNKKVRLLFQDAPLGTGHALLQAEGIKGRFIAMYGDDIYGKEDIENISQLNETALGSFSSENPKIYGVVETKDGWVIDLEEKPEKPKSNLVNCGLYLFDESIFSYLKKIPISPRGEYELTDAIKAMLAGGVKIKNHNVSVWIPLSYPWNILDVNKYLLDKYGKNIHPSVELRPGAVVEDPVAIDAGSVIGPNCYIRKYSSIGKNCKVGQAVEVKNSIIMDNSFVSHLSYVGDTIIGRKCNVGGGTIFANLRLDDKNVKMEINGVRVDSNHHKLGAIVGDGVKFGTRVTVMPGKRIWPNLLIPACMTVNEDIKTELPLSNYQQQKE